MSRLAPLLGLALVIAAGVWLLLGETHGPSSKVVVREEAEETPAPRLIGARDDADPDGATGPEESGRPAWWRLGFRVEGPDGSALAFRKAWLLDGDGRVARTLIPEAGETTGELLVSGTCRLVVEVEGLAPWSSERLIQTETGRRDVVVRPVPGLPLAGLVYRADGTTPLASLDVTVECIPRVGAFATTTRQTKTDGEGAFSLQGLPPGRVRIAVLVWEHQAQRRTTVVADAGDEDVRVVTEAGDPTCRLILLVADVEAGHAPDDTWIAVHLTADGEESLWMERWLEPRTKPPDDWYLGTYEARQGSKLRVRLAATGYEQLKPHVVWVPSDEGPHRVYLRLRPTPKRVATLTLRLLTSGRPVPRTVTGICRHAEMSIRREYEVTEDRITVRVLPGRHRVTVETPWTLDEESMKKGVLVGDVDVVLEAGERREVELPLSRGGFVFLRGDPDPWCPEATLTRGGERIARVPKSYEWDLDAGARCWAWGPVPPGTWRLAYDGTDTRWEGEVVVRPGEITTVRPGDLEEAAPIPLK